MTPGASGSTPGDESGYYFGRRPGHGLRMVAIG